MCQCDNITNSYSLLSFSWMTLCITNREATWKLACTKDKKPALGHGSEEAIKRHQFVYVSRMRHRQTNVLLQRSNRIWHGASISMVLNAALLSRGRAVARWRMSCAHKISWACHANGDRLSHGKDLPENRGQAIKISVLINTSLITTDLYEYAP